MPRTQRPAVAILVVLLLVWLIFTEVEYRSQPLALSSLVADRLAGYRHALDTLDRSEWGDFAPGRDGDAAAGYLNLTGFRERDGLAWEELDRFRDRALRLSRHAVPPVGGRWLWETAQGEPLWTDAAGTLVGQWVRRPARARRSHDSYDLARTVPAMDWVGLDRGWARNLTGAAGRILVRLEGNRTASRYEQLPPDQAPLAGGSIRSVRAAVTVEDTHGSGLDWEMRLWGVHWPRQGVVMMTTTSEKFDGIFGLPHLAPGPDFFQSSRRLLNQTLGRVLADKQGRLYADHAMPWSSDADNPLYTASPSPHCEFIMYAQIHPPRLEEEEEQRRRQQQQQQQESSSTSEAADEIGLIESELDDPRGAPIRAIPELRMSAVVYSPDCAFFLESKGPPDFAPYEGDHLAGMKTQVQLSRVKTWILVYVAAMFAQVFLLKSQIKETYTPSTLGRVSFATVSIMLIADGLTFTAAATWVSSAAATFLPTLALMFAAFLSMAIGGNLLARIHEVQQPTPTRPSADESSNNPSPTPSPGPVLPAPVTAGRGATAPSPPASSSSATLLDDAPIVSVPGSSRSPAAAAAQQMLTFQSVLGRFVLCALCVAFLAVTSSSWPARLRSLFFNALAAAYLSLWAPQIHRNAMRNCRRALAWPFVLGQSATRLLPVAYFWLRPDNLLYARTEPRAFAALAAWLWLQILLLAVQDALGPRFGLPAHWTPHAWDYHPVLRHETVEAGGLPIGLSGGVDDAGAAQRRRGSTSSSIVEGSSKGARAIDCAICREILEVPILRPGEDDVSVTSVFARRAYMVTPCRHIFHTACLEGWMRFRLQCPICREELPPL